jgi:FMN phosphatase YigB (HAD superfamily)
MTKKRKVAIFDIDGTIFRSSLLIELVETLIDRGLFKKDVRVKYLGKKELWENRKGGYDDYINAMVEVFLKNIKGISYSDFKDTADVVLARNSARVYRFTRELIKDLKKKDYFLLAISHSPKGIV